MVSHAFKKAFTDEDLKLSSDSSNSGAYICKECCLLKLLLQTIKVKYVSCVNLLSVQRVFRLAGTVSKKNEEALSQEILVGFASIYSGCIPC